MAEKTNWMAYLVGLLFFWISNHYSVYVVMPIILGFVGYYATKQMMEK